MLLVISCADMKLHRKCLIICPSGYIIFFFPDRSGYIVTWTSLVIVGVLGTWENNTNRNWVCVTTS